jgi:branched-chain amino acid transport system permease protein
MLILQILLNGILLGGMYILLAQGLNLVFGVMGVVNLAHGAIITVAGLFTFWFTTHTQQNPLLLLPVVFAATFAVGAVMQRFLLEPLAGAGRRAELLSLMITFGLSYVLVEIGLDAFGSQYVSLPALQTTWSVGGLTINAALVAAGALGAAISGLLQLWLHHTDSGKSLLATSQNQIGAIACGIDVSRMRRLAFALGASLAATAGILLIMVMPLAAQSADNLTVLAFVVVAMGGLGNYGGAAVAALLLGIAQSAVGYYVGGDAESVVPYALFIVFMIWRPQGLGGASQARAAVSP